MGAKADCGEPPRLSDPPDLSDDLSDLHDPRFIADPYPAYARLRAGAALPRVDGERWVLDHADVLTVLQDRRFGKAPTANDLLGADTGAPSLLSLNAPAHTRLRALVNRAFVPAAVERLRPRVAQIGSALLDQALRRGAAFDVVSDYAGPLPAIVIAELLGVPETDHQAFRAWSRAIAAGLDSGRAAEAYEQAWQARAALTAYFRGLVAARRRERGPDLLSALIAVEEDGDRLSPDELLSLCQLLLIAGHETTTHLIAVGTVTLLRHPEQWRRLAADPTLWPSAVEEILRFEPPVHFTGRMALEATSLHGVDIAAGEWVQVAIGAANRDPAVFADPDRFDVARAPNPHLSFGRGIHFCLGAPLARLEGQIALRMLTARCPGLMVAAPGPHWSGNYLIRGLERLPVRA